MIVVVPAESEDVQNTTLKMAQMSLSSAVQLVVSRSDQGLYRCDLSRMTRNPDSIQMLHLGMVSDVPPGQRRATWLLTDAVNLALTDPEAHALLHW